jgi:hypothetical protein
MGTGSAAAFRINSTQMEAEMTTVHPRTMQPNRVPRTTGLPESTTESDKLLISTRWHNFDVAVVSVEGRLDAAGYAELLDHALSRALLCRLLILNLERVRSLPCGGDDMLRALENRCAMADVELAVLHGRYAGAEYPPAGAFDEWNSPRVQQT